MPRDHTSVEQALSYASQCVREGRHADAEVACEEVLAFDPRCAEALRIWGRVALVSGRADTAVRVMQQAIAVAPDRPGYHISLGLALEARGDLDGAIAAFHVAIALAPHWQAAYMPLARALRQKGLTEAAAETARRAADLKRAHQLANEGCTYIECGRVTDAVAAARDALAASPDLPVAHKVLWHALTLLGDLQASWPHYRAAYPLEPEEPGGPPLWDGSPLDGRTIAVHTEAGFGDAIHLVRYVSAIAKRGGRVLLLLNERHAARLFRLFKTLADIEQIFIDEAALPPADVKTYLSHLPVLFNTSLDSVPAAIPYLHPDPGLTAAWSERLGDRDAGLRVGLVWAGDPAHGNDQNRSMRLAQLTPLWDAPGVTFFSVQYGYAAAQVAELPAGTLVDLSQQLGDFANTAALMAHLDLVVSVDSSPAHLAGAIGRPVWLLLSCTADVRWMTDREDSPWYPTMRLFRQRLPGDWHRVLDDVRRALAHMASEHLQRPRETGLRSVG